MEEYFYFEMTDLSQGQANYAWVARYKVKSSSQRGAITKLARHTGLRFRWDGLRYLSKTKNTCVYEMSETADELEYHYHFVEID
jgi:hypothetical protein